MLVKEQDGPCEVVVDVDVGRSNQVMVVVVQPDDAGDADDAVAVVVWHKMLQDLEAKLSLLQDYY